MRVNIEDLDKYKEFIASINSVPLEQIEWFYSGYLLNFPKEQIDEFKFVGLTNASFPDYVGLSSDGEHTE